MSLAARLWKHAPVRLGAGALAWLVGISLLHVWLNVERPHGRVVRMGHMPVLTNLACPLLDEASREREVRFSAIKYSSFAEMAESFRTGSLDAAFIIGPLPIVLRSQGVPARIVYIGNRHESTLVARKELGIGRGQAALLAGRAIAVPIRFSSHTLALRRLYRSLGLPAGSLKLVEMPPPDMAAALQTGSLDGYFVGEPFAARAVTAGDATVVSYVEDFWPGFIGNVLIVHDEMIAREPELVRRLVHGAIRSGAWARAHRKDAVAIAARYWGQRPELLLYAMDTPPGRVVFDRGVPVPAEIREAFDEMVLAGLIEPSASRLLPEVVDDSFARSAAFAGLTDDVRSVLSVP